MIGAAGQKSFWRCFRRSDEHGTFPDGRPSEVSGTAPVIPVLSVVVCTLNQANYLRIALASLNEQTLPREDYEVIVVDNGSTDSTKQTVASFPGFENLRYLYDPVPGLSHARNLGWQQALGKYVAYLDDDAVASPRWLERIRHRFETLMPRPSGVGGRILPIWEAERPPWLGKELEPYLSIVDWRDSPMFLVEDRFYLAGTNVCYERAALRECGGFPMDLGRKGRLLLSNEELWVQRFLLGRGEALWYDPEILVHHHIKAQRLTPAWFLERFFWQGVSDAILEDRLARWGLPQISRSRRLGHGLSGTTRDSIRSLAALLTGNRDVSSRCRIQKRLGRMISSLRLTFPGLEIPARFFFKRLRDSASLNSPKEP
jgi:glycosyltransferase involved in cell wall biosynthesis